MVRNYVRKTNRRAYSAETFEEVLIEIRAGRINAYNASKKYNIPLSTLMDRLKGKHGIISKSLGRRTVISKEHEKRLADGIKTMEKYGFELSRKEILELIEQFIKVNKLKTPFKDDHPGEDWFLGFKKRNNLSVKKPQGVEVARQQYCNPSSIQKYFILLENTMKDLGLENSPCSIWNLNESSFCTDPSKTKVVGGKTLPCTRTISAPEKENITVLLAASASGDKVPPLIIFKGKNVWNQWRAPENTGFPETTYAAAANGWVETTVFENYFEKQFLKSIGPNRPVLLIYDGHSTRISIRLLEKAVESNVIILKLPPRTSHVLQSLDLSAFKPLKTSWDQKLDTWQRRNNGKKLPKRQFSIMIGEIWRDLNPEIIMNGFKKAGIYPLSNNVVSDSTFSATALKQWEDQNLKDPITTNERLSIIEEIVCHPLIFSYSPLDHIVNPAEETFTKIEERSSEMLQQSFRNGSPIVACNSPQLSTLSVSQSVTFENLLLETVKTNCTPNILKKKKNC